MAVDNGDILKAVAEYVLADGTIAQNIFGFQANFDAQQDNPTTLAAIKNYVEDIYAPLLSYVNSAVSVNSGVVNKMEWDAGVGDWVVSELIGYFAPVTIFTGGTDSFPNQIAAVLIANTLRPKSRGRKFLIPFIESSAVGGDLVGAVMTALATTLAHYIADETVSGISLLSPGVMRSAWNHFLQFTTGEINSIVGTQRRRKPGVGT